MSDAATLQQRRAEAGEHWQAHGWPSQKLEDWRNTNLKTAAQLADGAQTFAGWQLSGGGDGVEVAELADRLVDPDVQRWLGNATPTSSAASALIDRNTASFEAGVLIRASRGAVAKTPIRCDFHALPATAPDGIQRVLLIAGDNSELTVILGFAGQSSGPFVRNIVCEIVALPGARVKVAWLQDEPEDSFHLATVGAVLHKDARLELTGMHFGAALGRLHHEVRMVQAGASCQLNGLYRTDGRRHVDCHVQAHHDAGHTDSNMLFKGILDDRSSAVFRGNVLIAEGAAKSTSEQLNRNLLLSDRATAHTKPQLEIDNDDVRAAHGATVGELDDNALFYLQSRGIDVQAAQRMLISGFAAEVIERLPTEALQQRYLQRFAV